MGTDLVRILVAQCHRLGLVIHPWLLKVLQAGLRVGAPQLLQAVDSLGCHVARTQLLLLRWDLLVHKRKPRAKALLMHNQVEGGTRFKGPLGSWELPGCDVIP